MTDASGEAEILLPDAGATDGEQAERPPDPVPAEVILDSGDAALTLTEADQLAADLGATVVLIAGAHDVGKTTMAVTLWGQFRHGPFAGFRFAGSQSLDAFDQRQFASRLSSGNKRAESQRTDDEDLRLLHLRLADTRGLVTDLLPTDIKGEYFEDVINGRPPTDGLQRLCARADKILVAIDGRRIADLEERAAAVFEAEQLIGGLTEAGWMHPDSPLLVLLTKNDLVVDADTAAWYDVEVKRLCTFARDRRITDVASAKVEARPIAKGFDGLLQWMQRPVQRSSGTIPRSDLVGPIFATAVMA